MPPPLGKKIRDFGKNYWVKDIGLVNEYFGKEVTKKSSNEWLKKLGIKENLVLFYKTVQIWF